MNFSTEVKQKLFSIIKDMDFYHWLFTKSPEKDFSRKKKWSFDKIMKFMLSTEGKSLKDELLKYFDFDNLTPSNSSFNQRRSQILPEAFEFLFHEFTNSFDKEDATYKGLRLIACDGSDLCIAHNPKDKTTYFQSSPDTKGFNQLHLNAFYDLCHRTYIDAIIQPARLKNEDSAMCDLVDRYSGKTAIFIADRNYENYNIFAHVEEKGMYYLIRVKDIHSTGILRSLDLPTSCVFDVLQSLTLTKKQTKEVKANRDKYRFVPSTSTFDYLDHHTNKFYDLNMRIVKFPIKEDTYECIITNLPQDQFSADEIKQLYAKRWGIETSYRELKYAIGLTRFHSKKPNYIMQEIWSRMTLYNFCEIITSAVIVEKNDNRKHTYQLNYTRAIRICCHFLSIKEEKAPPDVEYLIRHELLPVRTGRSDPRKVKPQSAISFLYRAA
jgi:hypothetical protein